MNTVRQGGWRTPTNTVAVGKVSSCPWAKTTLEIRPMMILNLSVDHRVADGVTAALFLERIAEFIENPYLILWSPADWGSR
jgi:pyruvate dehydrogenase E2 component (dihydrolipoamide acetyltransferase)